MKKKSDSEFNTFLVFMAMVILSPIIVFNWYIQNKMSSIWYVIGLILIFFILIILPTLLYKRKHVTNLQRISLNKAVIVFILSMTFFLFGIALYDIANTEATILPFEDNSFEFIPYPENSIFIRDLLINYNFVNYKGNISFNIEKRGIPKLFESIVLYLPPDLAIDKVRVYKENKAMIQNKDFTYEIKMNQNNDSKILILKRFSPMLDKFDILIEISKGMIPNARFSIESTAWRTYSKAKEVFIFELGDYKCNGACTDQWIDCEITQRGDKLDVKYPKRYYDVVGQKQLYMSFIINTIDVQQERTRETIVNIAVGLIVAGIVLVGEFLRRFLEMWMNKKVE